MNFNLSQIPDRVKKPRKSGLTMVMDKGLSVQEAKNFLSVSHPHVAVSYTHLTLPTKLEV